MFRQALAIQRKTLGDRHPVVATTLNSLVASAARQSGATTRPAQPTARTRWTSRVAALGPDHQLVAIYPINLASVQLARGTPAAAAEPAAARRPAHPIAARPAWCRAADAPFIEDDWSVGATKSLLGAALWRSGVTTKPKPCCSTLNAIWRPFRLPGAT